jgi:hypothetical protein
MSTKVKVERSTARLLENLMHRYSTKSMDETLRVLIRRAENIPDSMFGAHPEMKPFERTRP